VVLKDLQLLFFNDKNKNIARELVQLLEESGQEVDQWLYVYAAPQSYSKTQSRGGKSRGGGFRPSGRAGWSGRGMNNSQGPSVSTRERNSYTTYSNPSGHHSNGSLSLSHNTTTSHQTYTGPSYSSGGGGSFHSDSFEKGTDTWW